MTEWSVKVLDSVKGVGRKTLDKAQEYSLERLVWCLIAIGFCWTEVQNYHRYIFWQQMYLMAGLGLFYCIKLGCFSKYKRVMCAGISILGIGLTTYLVEINFFATYRYLNMPIGILATVLLNLVALVLWDVIQTRHISIAIGPSIALVLMIIAMQTSIYDYKRFYFYLLLGLLPFILMKKGTRTGSCVLNGMIDGLCIGFFIVQGYAWMHRPYNFSQIRYTGISNACTEMSLIYLVYFAAWIIRYVQNARKKPNVWNVVGRVFCWFMAAFVLALEYLTGSRSAVLAMMLMTIIATAIRHMYIQQKWWKNLIGFIMWPINCACIGVLSLALFPTAYASVRYLPAYFNEPDYVDSIGYRLHSRPIEKWGESFGWDFEYDEYAVKEGDTIDNPKYTSFAEATSSNLGRIIPGVENYLEDVLSEKLYQAKMERIEYYLEEEIYSKERHHLESVYYNDIYILEKEEVQYFETGSGIIATYKNIIGNLLNELILDTDDESLTQNTLVQFLNTVFEKCFSNVIVQSDAQESDEMLALEEVVFVGERGDSAENPWYSDETYPGNGMALRNAIHQYAISKLNSEGHKVDSFEMWVTSDDVQPHAHNIFLIMGYDFGIPTMILMILLFVSLVVTALYNIIRFGKTEYLLPLLLIAALTMFGWFESGFDYKSMIFGWVCWCSVFTDVLRGEKKADKKAENN